MKRVIINKNTCNRICLYPGCGVVLTKKQKKFCSHKCRNFVNSPNNVGGPKEKYISEYSKGLFKRYIDECERGHKPTIIPTKSSYIIIENVKLPTLEGYASLIGVSNQTLYNWAKRHTDFDCVLKRLKRIQLNYLVNNGLSGRYSPKIASLLLVANHGMNIKHIIRK